jgi:O-antigen ligase
MVVRRVSGFLHAADDDVVDVAFVPSVSLKPKALAEHGVFVKNYIDQSEEFALCAVALTYPVVDLVDKKKFLLAALLAATALSFAVNMTFVTVSRTALVTMPIMLAVFAFLHLKWRDIAIALCAAAVLVIAAWVASPQLESKMATFFSDYSQYKKSNEATSIGLRLEYWRKSLRFFAEAPVIGHGTGSTRGLFEKAATGRDDASGSVIGNPHNQTLNVAVQWGAAGVIVLYGMWFVHLLLFRGGSLAAWIGLLVVAQNVLSSLFNSHLFDFHEGWMYVLGVGVAGGMVLKTSSREATLGSRNSVKP